MTRRPLTSIAATFAVAALATASLALGAGAASATDPANTCSLGSGVGDSFETTGALWDTVCESDGTVADASTNMKSDAFDTFGDIAFDLGGPMEVAIGAPAADVTITNDPNHVVYEFTDYGVTVGVDDLVDVEVTRTFSGSFVTWEINVFDSDDHSPRPDVVLDFVGGFGADSLVEYATSVDGIIVGGDLSDPILAIQYTSTNTVNQTPLVAGDDSFALDFSGGIALTVAMIDYDCNNAGAAVTFAQNILPTLSSHVGESLSVGTGTFCTSTPSPVHLQAGQPFDYLVPVTVVPDSHDLAAGGQLYTYNTPSFITDEATNDSAPNIMPALHLTGVAPASGTFELQLSYFTLVDHFEEDVPFTIIIDPATLAATGVDGTPILWTGFGLAMLGGLFVLGAARRASRR